MAAPVKVNFKIYQGSTFREVLRWESSEKSYLPITGISKSAPLVITTEEHSIPVGWRIKVTNVAGMKEINSADTYHVVTAVTATSLTISSINSIGYTDYISNGVIEYNAPINLTGYTARMHLRSKLADTEIIEELTTENNLVVLNNDTKTINLNIPASTTAGYTFKTAVYSLEVEKDSTVTTLVNGVISLELEVTR